jgi:hypothetical protein
MSTLLTRGALLLETSDACDTDIWMVRGAKAAVDRALDRDAGHRRIALNMVGPGGRASAQLEDVEKGIKKKD